MKTLVILTFALALGAGGAANAASALPAHHAVRHTHAKPHLIWTSLRHHGPAHRMSPLARANGQAQYRVADGGGDINLSPSESETPGLIKGDGVAGYGWSNGKTQTVMGVYRRPPEPNLPQKDWIPEGRGAAGVSVNIKLGGGG